MAMVKRRAVIAPIIMSMLLSPYISGCRKQLPAGDGGAAGGYYMETPEIALLGEYNNIIIESATTAYDYSKLEGNAAYSVYNEGDEPANVKFAFPYTGDLYWPVKFRVTCDGGDIGFNPVFGWQGAADGSGGEIGKNGLSNGRSEHYGEDGAEGYGGFDNGGFEHFDESAADNYGGGFEHFNESAAYTLYTIRVNRSREFPEPAQKAYIGADFIVDVSKTRIVADGFGYAANAYGAVRVWSLSDGFDTGLERHLFIIGDDIELNINAYEDEELTRETDTVSVELERRPLGAREYLLMFSGPLAIYRGDNNKYGEPAENAEGKNPASAVANQQAYTEAKYLTYAEATRQAYAQSLYQAYAKALDELLEIHYFIPRGELYAKAETRRLNAIIFETDIPAGARRTLNITFPINGPAP